MRERTQGSKTFQYLVENKTMSRKRRHFLSSGERKGNSPNPALILLHKAKYRNKILFDTFDSMCSLCSKISAGGCKTVASLFIMRKVTKYFVSRICWEAKP